MARPAARLPGPLVTRVRGRGLEPHRQPDRHHQHAGPQPQRGPDPPHAVVRPLVGFVPHATSMTKNAAVGLPDPNTGKRRRVAVEIRGHVSTAWGRGETLRCRPDHGGVR